MPTKTLTRSFSLLMLMSISSVGLATDLETLEAQYSYTLGHQVAQQLVAKKLDVDGEAFAAAIADVLSGRAPQLSLAQMETAVQTKQAQEQERLQEVGAANLLAGKEFLAHNATQEGVQVLDSGLQYRVETEGTGAMPGEMDRVEVHYRGTLMDGSEFDSSYKRNKSAVFQVNRVIKGFSAALQMMKVGSKWTVFIPADMAYGERGTSTGSIGPNETLIFELELLDIKS